MYDEFKTKNVIVTAIAVTLVITICVIGGVIGNNHADIQHFKRVQVRINACKTIENESARATCISVVK